MSDDELEYLAPGFDPSTLTVPRIRSILVSHDVPYPASAKKPQLVDTFREHVTPKAPHIRAQRDRIRRTSKGITDMSSSQEGTQDSTADEDGAHATELMPPPPPPSTVKRRTKKSVLQPSIEADATPIAPKASPRKRSTKHPRASDSEAGGDADNTRPTSRKTRRSEALQTETSASTRPTLPVKTDDSPFSDDNPFQRGNSPLPIPATEPRRRTTGMKTDEKRAVSDRRKTDQPVRVKQEDGVVVPSSRTFEVPVSRVKAMVKTEPDDPLDPGEEFTPEEEQALADDRATNDAVVRRPASSSIGRALKSALGVILITLLAGYAAWWLNEARDLGYCGIGKPAATLGDVDVPDWMSAMEPQCQPCPSHGMCYADMEVRCDPDFVLKPHPLSLWGLLPLPPTCEPDSEKARKVKTVADRAVEELRKHRAQWECGAPEDATGKVVSSPEKDETELKTEVKQRRRKAMSEAEFEELWRAALPEIQAREEVTSNVNGITRRVHLSSKSLAELSLGCTLRRSARLALARHRVALVLLSAAAGLAAYLRHLFLRRRADRARVPALVAGTLDRLATQAARHERGAAAEAWISAGQLRDDVLRAEFSAERREAIWARVRRVVELNANVRASVREGRAGEVSRVWEWVGSVQDLAAWRGANGLEPGAGGPAPTRPDSPLPTGHRLDGPERRHWDEGRPVY